MRCMGLRSSSSVGFFKREKVVLKLDRLAELPVVTGLRVGNSLDEGHVEHG